MEKDLFQKTTNCYRKVLEMQDNLVTDKDQIIKQFDILADVMKEVASNCFFSPNETFEEILTENLRFLLTPFYQGELFMLLQENRDKNFKLVLQFYDEFFKILKNYKFVSKEEIDLYNFLYLEAISAETKGKENSDNYEKLLDSERKKETKKIPDLTGISQDREAKIKEYKYKKSLLESIKLAEKRGEDESREYWTNYISLSWKKMLDNLRAIKMEFETLAFLGRMKESGKYNDFSKPQVNQVDKKMEMLKITPDNINKLNPDNKLLNSVIMGNPDCGDCTDINKLIDNKINTKEQVFRNPNPTTMTLDEFADKQIIMMQEQKIAEEQSKVRQKAEEDFSDNDEEIDDRRKKEKRAWDDWKDLNEKGAGNKMGK